jgi:LysM repeat protein
MDQTIKSLLKNIKSHESLISFLLGILFIVVMFVVLYQRFFPNNNNTMQFNTNESSTAIFQDIQLTEDEYLKSTGSALISETNTFPVELSVTAKPFLTDLMHRESTTAAGFGQLISDVDFTNNQEYVSVDLEEENDTSLGFFSRLQNTWDTATENLRNSPNNRAEKLADSSPDLEEQKTNELELPKIYTITQGDTLWDIAQQFYGSGYRWTIIAETNGLGDGNQIAVGQEISLPKDTSVVAVAPRSDTAVTVTATLKGPTYTVSQGECLWSIAQNELGNGLQWNKLFDANSDSIRDPDLILAGQELRIPRT